MRVRFRIRFSECSASKYDVRRNNNEILRMLRTGARFSLDFSRCFAREGDFQGNKYEILGMFRTHGSAIFFKILSMLRTGARVGSEF